MSKQVCHQALAQLEPGQSTLLGGTAYPGQVVTQFSRVGDVYYVVGPGFSWFLSPDFLLSEYFEIARANQDPEAAAVERVNGFLADNRAPADSRIHVCQGLPEAVATACRLFGW
jgi:hypothetical protein